MKKFNLFSHSILSDSYFVQQASKDFCSFSVASENEAHSVVSLALSIRPWWELSVGKALSFIVPLLALPQITHYILDGFIWKIKKEEFRWSGEADIK